MARTRFSRTATALSLGLILVASAEGALGYPGKDYRVQETTRCANGQGCPRMIRNAINHAQEFCREEGGVQRGATRRDYRCEQRGIYCVASGRIECNGRFDPSYVPGRPETPSTPGPPGLQVPTAHPPNQTCFDVDCNRFVSHAPGRQEQGTHACPFGFLVAGVSGRSGDIVCQEFPRPVRETRLETETRRDGLLACPKGMVVRGVSADRKTLLCAGFEAELGPESTQDESSNRGLQVCNETEDGPRFFVTGVDEAHDKVLCAPVGSP